MLYPKNNENILPEELFKNPTAEYRGTPFWAWNCKLEKDLLLREIDELKEMGMGGFHIHCRSGLETEYLGKEYMELVRASYEKAKDNKMLCWLYDEDRWPSGFGGGYVTKETKYRSRFLVFTQKDYDKMEGVNRNPYSSTARPIRSNNRYCLGVYEIMLKNGELVHYKRLEKDETPSEGSKVWRAYLEVSGDNPWFNNQAYVNTLDKEAIKRFTEVAHEKYYEEFKEEFGKTINTIFTDEPQFCQKDCLGFAEEVKDVIFPFTDDFEDTFKKAYGYSLIEHLPEIFWELPNGEVSLARYHYHDHLSERFVSGYVDTIGNWCKEHNIMLTGHVMAEDTLASQTGALGEAMRCYRSFGVPGIDILSDRREYATAKQAQSAAHQFGAPGVLSELYGVTNWNFDFRGHKLQGDWQAALGITVRVHHLTWVSMAGEAKRDYPASIGYQSPWYKEYPLIENHFARLNTALTRGKVQVRVGVIHPIESYWLHWGPKEQTSLIREEMQNNFKNLINWLIFGLVDFDYISESLLPIQSEVQETSKMKVGKMNYDVIIVPECETLRSTTIERLEAFSKAGGKVIFAGELPKLLDARISDRALRLAENCCRIPFTQSKILKELEEYRDLDIRTKEGARADNLLYQMRKDGDKKWVFICHGKKLDNPDIAVADNITIKIKGKYTAKIYNTMNGEVNSIATKIKAEKTEINYEFYQHDSLLLCLEELKDKDLSLDLAGNKVEGEAKEYRLQEDTVKEIHLTDPVNVTLSEPNVVLLDMAEYSFDGREWFAREELLRIDNIFRKELGYPLRMEAYAQPWVNKVKEVPKYTLSLKFRIKSEIKVDLPYLALENAETTEIIVNGIKVISQAEGFYVDESIKKVKLPSLPIGESVIVLNIPFTTKTNVEWCYLLGDFGVKVSGSHAVITEPVRKLAFGDWSNQGLPFYAGNVTYHCVITSEKGNLSIEASQFRNPLLSVAIDGKEAGKIAFAPYRLSLGDVEAGEHFIDITAFGNRVNTFGTVHNCNRSTTWFGPNSWRTSGSSWSYEYRLRETGVLISPVLEINSK